MKTKYQLKLAIFSLATLVIVSCTLLYLTQEDQSLNNPLVIVLIVLAVVWNIILIPVGLTLTNRFTNNLLNFIISSAELAEGNTSVEIELSESDSDIALLNHNLEIIRENMENASKFAAETGEGNLDLEFEKAGDNDQLGSALLAMRDQLKQVAIEEKRRSWFNEGVAQFSDILRRNNDNLDLLSSEIISNLVQKINAQLGTLFIKHHKDGVDVMIKEATYAYDRQKFEEQVVQFKDGMIGQVWAECKPTYIENVPKDYATISSGLGKTPPSSLYIVPLLVKDEVKGIIEIASLNTLEQYQKEFILKISESIAATLDSVQTNIRTAKLLQESQQMQKEMADQEEVMRQSMEEMRATQEQMQEQEHELKAANEESKKANKAIQESQRQLESRINILNQMCLVSITDRKGVITEVNSKFMEVAKYTEEELIGQPHNIVRHPDMPAAIFKLMWQTIGKGQPFRGMVKNRAKDGSTYWVDAVINPIMGEDGKPQGYIGVRYLNTDIIQANETYTYDLGEVKFTVPTK